MEMKKGSYSLGNGLYVFYDGGCVWLTTEDHEGITHNIPLDKRAIKGFIFYLRNSPELDLLDEND